MDHIQLQSQRAGSVCVYWAEQTQANQNESEQQQKKKIISTMRKLRTIHHSSIKLNAVSYAVLSTQNYFKEFARSTGCKFSAPHTKKLALEQQHEVQKLRCLII
jgi:hypothetical protein